MSFYEFLQIELFFSITVSEVIQVILVLIVTRAALIGSLSLIKKYNYKFKILRENQRVFKRLTRAIINLIGFLSIISIAGFQLSELLSHELLKVGQYPFRVSNIVNAILVIFIAQGILWLVSRILEGFYEKQGDWDIGTRFAINQILKYLIYTLALLSSIQALGFDLTVIWGGAAALLVGFGLGLQQTFTDLISGIFMLVERGVNVGHILQFDDKIGKVKKIGFRASEIVTRDNIVLLIPNSKLVADTVVNWSHNDTDVRFEVEVGVAYGSNTELVEQLLSKVANDHKLVLKTPKPIIRFVTFGDSSLNFKVLFWASSEHFLIIEDVKSDLNYAIDKAFREHNISIPFPQRDVWVKTV